MKIGQYLAKIWTRVQCLPFFDSKCIRRSESAYIHQVNGFVDGDGLVREIGCTREMADALWEGHTLLKNGMSAHRQTDRQTDS